MSTTRAATLVHLAATHLRSPIPSLPFLYCTRTILRPSGCGSGLPSTIRKKSTSRNGTAYDDFSVPFDFESTSEGSESTKESQDQQAFQRNRLSTITKSERAVFEKLFAQSLRQPAKDGRKSSKSGRALNGRPGNALNEAIYQDKAPHITRPAQRVKGKGPQYQWPTSLHELAEEVQRKAMKERELEETSEEVDEKADKEKSFISKADVLREREYKRIEQLILAAETDAEIWAILETELFSVVRSMKLDEEHLAQSSKPLKENAEELEKQVATLKDLTADRKSRDGTSDLSILGPNYPTVLVLAVRQLRREFPASSLPLAILPAMKALGRESFVLGASTVLYNELIVYNWLKYADFQAVSDLLREMDSGGLDFDENTLEILDHIEHQMRQASNGHYGPAFQTVWNMEMFRRSAQKLARWRRLVRSRMEAEALRKASAMLPDL